MIDTEIDPAPMVRKIAIRIPSTATSTGALEVLTWL
jgi:hypothetical protein